MKGTNLGEFQELILLTIGTLHPEAYGVSIKEEILNQTGRNVTLSTVHSALVRLEEKGYVKSEFGEATNMRGGKRKRYFVITAVGVKMLAEAKEQREALWDSLPEVVFKLDFQ